MPDPLKVSTMSFGSLDGRSHPWIRRFGGDLFGSKWGVKIDESAEDTVVLLNRFGGIGLRVFNQIRIVYVGLKGFHIDGLQLTKCDGLWYSVTVVCREFSNQQQQKNDQKWHQMVIRTKRHTCWRKSCHQESDRDYG